MQGILEWAGHKTYATLVLEEILDYCEGGVDVVITDLQMPDIHGLDLIMRLRSQAPDVAVIVVSGTGPDQLEMAEAVGAVASFTKPVESEALLQTVARVIADRPEVGVGAPDLTSEGDPEVETSIEEKADDDAEEEELVEREAPLSLADVMEIEGVTSKADLGVETSVEEDADEEELVESEPPLSPADVTEMERLLERVDEILLSQASVKDMEAVASEADPEVEASVDEKADAEEVAEGEILLSPSEVTEIERLMKRVDEIRLSPADVRGTEAVAPEADLEVETSVDEGAGDDTDDEESVESEVLPAPPDVIEIETVASKADLEVETSVDEKADDGEKADDADEDEIPAAGEMSPDREGFESEVDLEDTSAEPEEAPGKALPEVESRTLDEDEQGDDVDVESAGAAVPELGDSGGVEVGVASAMSGIEEMPRAEWRIVVAEDDDEYVSIIERALEKAAVGRVEIRRGRTGPEALALLRESMPDLLLLDLKMPGMPGHEVLAEIKSDSALRSVPVVVLSSSDRDDSIAKTFELGGNHYITKPSDPAELEAKLGAVLRNLQELGRVSRGSAGASTTAVSAVDPDAMLAQNALRVALVVGVLIALYVFGKISGVF